MRWPFRKQAPPEAAPPPPSDLREPREGARYYALCGDNIWGLSITWQSKPGEHPSDTDGSGTFASCVGWLPHPRPERGDVIVARMKGGAGEWIVQSVERGQGVDDMFFAELRGVVGYMDPAPRFESATELLKPDQQSEFV